MRAIVETHPESVEARTFLGKLLGEAGLTAEAAANYERVTELFPEMEQPGPALRSTRSSLPTTVF